MHQYPMTRQDSTLDATARRRHRGVGGRKKFDKSRLERITAVDNAMTAA
jgi:hypothetical protein